VRSLWIRRLASLLAGFIAVSSAALTGQHAPDGAATAFYAVAYIEVMPRDAARAVSAFTQYRDAIGSQAGYGRAGLFEQAGRPGHFAVIETWRDMPAFDARSEAAQKAFHDELQPIRVSGYDERPYKTLSVAAAPDAPPRGAVAVITHVDVSPDPRVAAMLERLADDSRRETGNIRFDVLQHTMRANHFTIVEVWRNRAALEAHASASHTRGYRDELQPFTGSPLDERLYTPVR
jgi:quinol monooxygenase YgiN